MDYSRLYLQLSILLGVHFTREVLCTGHFIHTYFRETYIGGTVDIKLNLTEEGWYTDDADFSVLAWNNASHPIAKLQKGAEHADCYNDLSFLGSARCNDVNVSFIESNVYVDIRMRVISEAMVADYIFYPYYGGVKHNLSLVRISVRRKDSTPNTTSGKSHTGLSSTNLPSEANTNTRPPVRDQASRSGCKS